MPPRPRRSADRGAKRREARVRVQSAVARRVRDGHPWVFREALKSAPPPLAPGQVLDLVDEQNRPVARAMAEPGGKPLLRAFSRVPGTVVDARYLAGLVDRNLAVRRALLGPGPDEAYRLINAESEGLPGAAVDRYGPYVQVVAYSPMAESYLDPLREVLVDRLGPRGIYLQRRYAPPDPSQPRDPAQLVCGDPAPAELVVTERHLRFLVDVTAPTGTGLFMDMRTGRELVERLSAGRRVLNCFSYTGAFTVVAALAGSPEVVAVDAAARAHARARRNLRENRVDPADRRLEFITGDAFAATARLARKGRIFDLVVLDPPTYASTRSRRFTAVKDYAELVFTALQATAPGGLLLVACNAARLPASDLERAVGQGAARARRSVVVCESLGQPPDYPTSPAFPEGRHLKLLLVRTLD